MDQTPSHPVVPRFLDVMALPSAPLPGNLLKGPVSNLLSAVVINPEHIVSVCSVEVCKVYGPKRLGPEDDEQSMFYVTEVTLSTGRVLFLQITINELADALRAVGIGTVQFP